MATRLRRDAGQSRLKRDTIDAIIETVKEMGEEDSDLEEEEQRTRSLQGVRLDYHAVNRGGDDLQTVRSRQFYRDADAEIKKRASKSKPKKKKKEKTLKGRSRRRVVESESSEEEEEDVEEGEDDEKLDPVLKARGRSTTLPRSVT